MANSKITVESLNLHYGENHALKNVNMEIADHAITAFIGPSGCGKSTFLRCLNRMNDLVDGVRITGEVKLDDEDIYAEGVDTTVLRKRIGMKGGTIHCPSSNICSASSHPLIMTWRTASKSSPKKCPRKKWSARQLIRRLDSSPKATFESSAPHSACPRSSPRCVSSSPRAISVGRALEGQRSTLETPDSAKRNRFYRMSEPLFFV